MGSVADYLEVDSRYERAVEACLGDLLQHVVVQTHDQAAAGLRLAEAHNAGRVGFVVAERRRRAASRACRGDARRVRRALLDVVRVIGPGGGRHSRRARRRLDR